VSGSGSRLAFVGPLPPVRSGIADYARDLLPYVARDFDVEIFVEDRHATADATEGSVRVRPASELRRRRGEFRHVVYQLGNNLHHRFVLELAHELGGIVVLHDLVLHHLYEEIAGVEDEWEAYGDALRESYGPIGGEVMRWKRWRLASELENFELPLFEAIAAASRGVLVHSEWAKAQVCRRLPSTPVRRIRMGVPPEAALDRDLARRRLGLGADEMIVGAFGFITPIKRLDVVASALRRVWPRRPEIRLVLVGEASAGVRLEEMFRAEEFADGRVVHRGYVSAEEYRDWMAATDVAVNLRFPSAGETSASLLRLLGAGKCTLVSAYRQFLEMPADVAVRIPLGADEESALVDELGDLSERPERRLRIGDAARAFVAEEHSMERAAADFREAVAAIDAAAAPASSGPAARPAPSSRAAAIRGHALGVAEVQCRAGKWFDLELRVRNEGESRWISTPEAGGGYVGVGAEVLGADRSPVARIRPVLLPRDVSPGEDVTIRLRAAAPSSAGEYRIQPTVVHFGRDGARAAGREIRFVVFADAD